MIVLWLVVAGVGSDITPPVLVKRNWPETTVPAEVASVTIEEADGTCALYWPKTWKPTKSAELRIHFHTADWLPVKEHLDAGLTGPLLVWNRPGASSAYRVPFQGTTRFADLVERCKTEMIKAGAAEGFRFDRYRISSFSAGSGAVRELMKDPEVFQKTTRVVLCDSIYASLDESDGSRKAKREDVEAWFPLAEAAVRGEKTFLLTFSEVPTTYASSSESGSAIAAHVGGVFEPAPAVPVAGRPVDQLSPLRRFDKGNLHLWLYPGSDGVAHVIHVHNLARLWKALDAAGRP